MWGSLTVPQNEREGICGSGGTDRHHQGMTSAVPQSAAFTLLGLRPYGQIPLHWVAVATRSMARM
jgi:hypothetical protein